MNEKLADRRVRKTKKALRQGLATLMEEKKIRDITVRELTDLVDMHRGTFYLHYKDIYDLQEQIENEIMAEVAEIFDEFRPMAYGDSPRPILLALMEYMIENKGMCRALLGNNANRSFVDKLSAALQEKCTRCWVEELQIEAGRQEMEYLSCYMISGYIGIIGKWTVDGMQESPEELADLLSRFGMYGISFVEKE